MRFCLRGAWLCLGLLGCASGPSTTGASEDYGVRPDGGPWVRGPWAVVHPSRDVDEVIDQLCPAVVALPRARNKEMGQEYCGAIYSLGDGVYYASTPSPLGPMLLRDQTRNKFCKPPRYVEDSRGRTVVLADYHSHPWQYSPMSQADRRADRQRWSIRIQFDTSCHVMKLVPYLSESRPGEVYERQAKSWKLVGFIKPENKDTGTITFVTSEEKQ